MSLASGITLQPIRMGSIMATTGAVPEVPRKTGYVPPHMRSSDSKESTNPISLTITEKSFPTMGSGPAVVPLTAKKPAINFKKAAEAGIEHEKSSEEERNRVPESDLDKMSVQELYRAGWDIIHLGRHNGAYQDELSGVDYETPIGNIESVNILETMDAEMEAYFLSCLRQDYRSHATFYKKKTRSQPQPLDDACMRGAKLFKERNTL